MNPPNVSKLPGSASCALLIGLLVAASPTTGQTLQQDKTPARPATSAQVTAPASRTTDDEIIELSPFTVQATSDTSYGALNSNSITSFNVELEKLPMSADIFTGTFMDDTNSTTLENMLRAYSSGSGTGSAAGDVSGIPVNQPMDRGGGDSVSAGVQLRGLGAAVVKQDGFMLPSPAGTGLNSTFGVERVEVINGPQALLYGNGGGGGVVNIISKQARFGGRNTGSAKFTVDNYGHGLGKFDYNWSTDRVAVAFSLLRQQLGDSRDWIGGPMNGAYLQLAAKYKNTVIRFTGKDTRFDRITQQTITLNAGSTTIDARNGQNIRYLLASGQMEASATGASGAGVIGNGYINWDNVDSYAGNMREEKTEARLGMFTAETTWTKWLSTQISAGYQSKISQIGFGSGITFYSPTASGNPLPGEWTIASGGSSGSAYSNQPSHSKSFRFSALLTNRLFDGKAESQTIFGADFTEGHYANENYSYYEADADFNPVYTSDGARIQMDIPGVPYFSVTNGPVKYPFYSVGTKRITYGGKNYVAMLMNLTDPTLISPSNPQGVTSGDLYIHSRAISRGLYAVNFTQWADRKLTSLVGLRYVSAENRQFASSAIPAIEAQGNNLSYSAGLTYALRPTLHAYATVSDTYNLPGVLLTVPADPMGNPAPISHAVGEEVGLKVGSESGRLSGSISVYAVQADDDPYAIPTQLRDSINPNGINGRYRGATGSVIAVSRKSTGAQLALTASPTKGWRARLSASYVHGEIGTDTSYPALYNDQFYANSSGEVTYANGTVVYVPATTTSSSPAPKVAGTSGYIPLTIAMLSDPSGLYYVNPDSVTGKFGSSRGRNVLNNTTAAAVLANGSIKTGVAGIAMSEYQLTGITPVDTIVTSRAGDRTTGYPTYSFNFTNLYTVQTGRLKGFRFGGTVSASWQLADYYYYPDGYSPTAKVKLFSRPTQVLLDGILGYEHRFSKVTLSTQLNISNLLDTYKVIIRPNNVSGYSGVNSALRTAEPRSYTWSCTLKF